MSKVHIFENKKGPQSCEVEVISFIYNMFKNSKGPQSCEVEVISFIYNMYNKAMEGLGTI